MKVTSLYMYETLQTSSQHLHLTAELIYASRVPKCSKRTEVDEESPNVVKTKIYGSLTVDIPMKKSTTNPKRSAPDDDVSGDVKQPLKKPKVSKSQSAKSLLLSNSVAVSKSDPEDTAVKKLHSVMKQETKKKKAHPQESDDEDHMPKKPVSKKARFDEEPKLGYVLLQKLAERSHNLRLQRAHFLRETQRERPSIAKAEDGEGQFYLYN